MSTDTSPLARAAAEFPRHEPRPPGAPTALQGIRVVDFSHFIAGPLATMILADMGAEVIKVEAPVRGDDARRYPPMHPQLDQGAPFVWSNRNKKSIALDLKSPQGLALARDLVCRADVLVENFSSGVMRRLGLDHETCLALNPRLVYCSVAAYSREGAFADRFGFDPIAQAESGFVSMNGYPDREGVRALSPVMDISTAMMVGNAVLGALLARERLGRGQRVEVSLFDTAVLMTGYATMQSLFTGKEPQRSGNTAPDTCPSGAFRASDRTFYINSGNDRIFQRLMGQVLERPDVAADADYATGPLRIRHRERLFAFLDEAFARHDWAHWQARMRAAGVPYGLVRTVGEAIRSPEARDHELVTRIPHPVLGWVPNVRLPIRYAATPMADPTPAPAIGQHTAQVLAEVLGYDAQRIAGLAEGGAFGTRGPARRGEPGLMTARTLRGKVAVVGIGETTYYKHGQSPDAEFKLALQAILAACADAGIHPHRIDGFASYSDDRSDATRLAVALGLPRLRSATMQWGGGGGGCCAAVANGAAAIATGQADCVVVFRSLAQGQHGRFGHVSATTTAATVSGERAYLAPYGVISPPQRFAMRVRRYMHEHGVRQEALRAIAMASYHHAQNNPRAVMHGKPLDAAKYDASRWIVEPLHLFDCCMENDGAAALILMDAQRAADCAQKPVYLLGAAAGSGPRFGSFAHNSIEYASGNFGTVAPDLYRMAGVEPKDVGVVQAYDSFTGGVLMALAEHGFFPPEAANDFLVLDNLVAKGGRLPLNTSGGNLAECYVHGFELVLEAVRQVRGTSSNQAARNDVALVVGGPMVSPVSDLLLGSGDVL